MSWVDWPDRRWGRLPAPSSSVVSAQYRGRPDRPLAISDTAPSVSEEKMTALEEMTLMVCCRDSCFKLLLIREGITPIMLSPIQ